MKKYCCNFRLILTILFVSTTFFGLGQNLKKAMAKVHTKEYDDAKKIFSKAVKKKKDPIVVKYGLALIYADTAYKKKNLGRAYRNLKYCLKRWDKLPENKKQEYKTDFQITHNVLVRMDSLTQALAYENFQKNPTPDNRDKFEKSFRDAPIVYRLRQRMANKEFQVLRYGTNPDSIDDFILRYPNASMLEAAVALSRERWLNLYREFRSDGVLASISTFEKKYPHHKIPKDTIAADKNIAFKASSLMMHKGFYPSFKNRYQAYIKEAGHKHGVAFVALQRLMAADIAKKQWAKARATLEEFAPFFLATDKRIIALRKLLSGSELTPKIETLGTEVNSNKSEYVPVISANNKKLFFCGFNRTDGVGLEDIFVSEKEEESWQTPVVLRKLCSPSGYEAPLAISTDGNTLLFFKNRQLYFSKKTLEGWGEPERIKEPVNSKFWQGEAQPTSDGKYMIFASDRPGGQGMYYPANTNYYGGNYGNIDIYVAPKLGPNKWGKPINLGATINTPFCERGVFLHPDMKTLYFCSDGRGGLGGLDIYKSTRLNDDSWTEWSEPVNLGKGVNTADDDWGFKISTDGTHAYFSAQGDGNYDLYKMNLPQFMRPQHIATISGQLVNTSNEPLSGIIRWEDLTTGQSIGEAETDPADGSFFLVVPLGKNYGYFVEKEGYFPASSNIDLRMQKVSVQVDRTIVLQSWQELETGKAVRLNNLFFDTDSYKLKKESFPELNRLARLLSDKNKEKIEIRGHTDNVGGKEHNQKLSERRAKSVKEYLISRGLSADAVLTSGFGQDKPVASNKTKNGRAQNRRVEIKLLQ